MPIDSLMSNNVAMTKPVNLSGLNGMAMADRTTVTENAAAMVNPTRLADGVSVSNSATAMKTSEAEKTLDAASVQRMNESLQKAGSNILFEPDEDTGKMLFLMKDAETGETIRQIPNEVVLKISQAIGDFLKSAQFEGKSASGASLTSAISGMVTNVSV